MSAYVVIQRHARSYEIWEMCSEPACGVAHKQIATTDDKFTAGQIVRALEATR